MQLKLLNSTRYSSAWCCLVAAGLMAALCGCVQQTRNGLFGGDSDLSYYRTVATDIEYPDVPSGNEETASTVAPLTLDENEPIEYWDLTLQEAIQTSLARSEVLRDLGGLVLQSPASAETVYEPAMVETDPRFGVDAALSAFDTSFSNSAFFENNDRPLNNPFFVGGRTLKQDLGTYSTQLGKTTAQGTEFFFRHNTDYDANNTPGNPFPSTWNTMLETEFRQPLLQGFGAQFNRIAGPGTTAGVYNGVLIARINTDISLADFEMGIRNLISDIETTYWELYFGYRDLDAKIAARQRALDTWRRIHALNVTGRRGGEGDKEAQAREQYFRLDEDVQNALAGRLQDRTRTFTFRGTGGIQNNERRLRLLMGIPINDGRLIRPADEPMMVEVVFDWQEMLAEALMRRAELRRQKWQIKRREMELIASRNFLLPRLDAIALYRWRGFGQRLLDSDRGGRPRFSNAFMDLTTGDFQEWQMGFEFEFPIGYRQAHAGVRNAQLNLTRERALLQEQEREVTVGLSDALADMKRSYRVAQTNFNRRHAAKQALESIEATYQVADENQKTQLLAVLLDVQRRLADAESRYYRSLVEYSLAIKQIHYQKGSLLDYSNVSLSENAWPDPAYRDAANRERLRGREWRLNNFLLPRRMVVSQGAYGQQTMSAEPNDEVYYPYDAARGSLDDQPAGSDDRPARARLDSSPSGNEPVRPAPPQPISTANSVSAARGASYGGGGRFSSLSPSSPRASLSDSPVPAPRRGVLGTMTDSRAEQSRTTPAGPNAAWFRPPSSNESPAMNNPSSTTGSARPFAAPTASTAPGMQRNAPVGERSPTSRPWFAAPQGNAGSSYQLSDRPASAGGTSANAKTWYSGPQRTSGSGYQLSDQPATAQPGASSAFRSVLKQSPPSGGSFPVSGASQPSPMQDPSVQPATWYGGISDKSPGTTQRYRPQAGSVHLED